MAILIEPPICTLWHLGCWSARAYRSGRSVWPLAWLCGEACVSGAPCAGRAGHSGDRASERIGARRGPVLAYQPGRWQTEPPGL